MASLYIGLMSGTSLDGLDAVLVELPESGGVSLKGSISRPLPASLRDGLVALTQPGNDEIRRMGRLHVEFGRFCADLCLTLLHQADTQPSQVIAIGSHGQTIRHHPDDPIPFTLQIGDPSTIAQLTGITTVADLRLRDMAVGGEGAPLVPAFHAALLRQPSRNLAVLNIGGMANLTLLPSDFEQPVIGFDTGPGNILLDAWCIRHTGEEYDADGAWGASGQPHPGLLERLLQDPFFSRSPPKSTGRELFNSRWLEHHMTDLGLELAPKDVQATLVQLTAHSIGHALDAYAPSYRELAVCGGGAYNGHLMRSLQECCELRVASTAEYGMQPRWMEACAFAWLARETLHGRPGNLPSVTGASEAVVLGGIYPGRMWPTRQG